MNPGDPRTLFDRHAARILARWRDQLRAMPPSSALAAPELLAPLMAPALARVRHESVQPDDPSMAVPQSPDCLCGLNPLITFYLTGECATFDVLWAQPDALAPLTPVAREEICRRLRGAWHRVATSEVSLFCSLCQRGAALAAMSEAEPKEGRHAVCATETGPKINAPVKGASEAARNKALATARRSAGTPD